MTTKSSYFDILERKFGSLSFGEALRSWRLSEGLTQKDFAGKLRYLPKI